MLRKTKKRTFYVIGLILAFFLSNAYADEISELTHIKLPHINTAKADFYSAPPPGGDCCPDGDGGGQ